jgi:hypothetical protein
MATYTEVKAGLDSIATLITSSGKMRDNAQAQLLSARNQLANITTQFADVIATIDGYAPTGAAETFAQAEKAKLQADFTALKSALETALDSLGVSYS